MQMTFQIYQNAKISGKLVEDLREEVGWERMDGEYDAILERSHFHLSILDEGALVGFVNVISDGQSFAFLCDLMVNPLLGGQGAGRALIELAVRLLREQGIRTVQVVFDPALEGFYKACGFEVYAGGSVRT